MRDTERERVWVGEYISMGVNLSVGDERQRDRETEGRKMIERDR